MHKYTASCFLIPHVCAAILLPLENTKETKGQLKEAEQGNHPIPGHTLMEDHLLDQKEYKERHLLSLLHHTARGHME